MNRTITTLALAALIQQAPAVAQVTSPSPTERRLQQLEAEKRSADAAEAAKWRTFPKPKPALEKASGDKPAGGLLRESQEWILEAVMGSRLPKPNSCAYYWPGWRLEPLTGIRSTAMRCGVSLHQEVAVKCSSLELTTAMLPKPPSHLPRWSGWRLPATEGERQMLVALCDNLTSSAPAGQRVR